MDQLTPNIRGSKQELVHATQQFHTHFTFCKAFTSPSAVWALLYLTTAGVPSGYAVYDEYRRGREGWKGMRREGKGMGSGRERDEKGREGDGGREGKG